MNNRQKGIACILASAFGFAVMAACVRLCDDYGAAVSSFQKSLFRNLIALVVAAVVFLREREHAVAKGFVPVSQLPLRAWLFLMGRSLAGVCGVFGNFYALSIIPIGEAMTLNKTAPFFTVLFSWLFLRERTDARRFLCLILAFAGVLLVMKPGLQGAATGATLCALGGGLGAGIAYTCVRELGLLKVEGSFIVLFFSAFSTLASLPFMLGGIDPMTPAQIVIMLGAGLAAAVGQFGITAAYRFAPAREIAVFDYTNIIFTALLGFIFFAQTPDLISVAGFLLIVLAALRNRS